MIPLKRTFCNEAKNTKIRQKTKNAKKIKKSSQKPLTVGTLSAIITNVAAAKANKRGGQQAGYGPVVQLVRTLACHARGRQFEPDSGRHLLL